jgi:hypothetical protein
VLGELQETNAQWLDEVVKGVRSLEDKLDRRVAQE